MKPQKLPTLGSDLTVAELAAEFHKEMFLSWFDLQVGTAECAAQVEITANKARVTAAKISEIAFIAAEQFDCCRKIRGEEHLPPSAKITLNRSSESHGLAEEVRQLRGLIESKFLDKDENIDLVDKTNTSELIPQLHGLIKTLTNENRGLRKELNQILINIRLSEIYDKKNEELTS